MAPVKATAVGITPQIIDDEELSKLQKTLNSFSINNTGADLNESSEIHRLLELLNNYSEWKFEEQVDLYEWIPALNSIDTILSHYIANYPKILLLKPMERQSSSLRDRGVIKNQYAECAEDTESVPESVINGICTILMFLSSLLSNCTNKSVFNSTEEVVDLLAAGDDSIASFALQTLAHVATPPALHKQQAPDGNQHSSALHTSKTESHKRLVSLARGWGSRGSGLGLYACVTADDSEFGQGELPPAAGEINFEFFSPAVAADSDAMQLDSDGNEEDQRKGRIDHKLVSIHIPTEEIVNVAVNSGSMDTDAENSFTAKKQKRQRIGTRDTQGKGMKTLSTARLFFKSLEAAGGREKIPEDRLFALLADVRLARSFHSTSSRISAVENRLMALISILHAHPSQDIMSGYFQAQPELCVELIDLLRPTVSSNTVSSASTKPNGSSSLNSIKALACPQEVPYLVRNLAVEALTALVARRDGASGGLTGVARQSNILNELGVGKGMYLGLLPTLVRYSLASLTNFLTADEQVLSSRFSEKESEMDDVALDIGLAFLKASSPAEISEKDQVFRALRFVDSVLTLTSAVVSAPSGTAALTDCGMIPSLVSTAAFNTQTPLKALVNLSTDLSTRDIAHIHGQVRFVASQAIQIIEGAIVTHNNALSAFHDLKGVDVLITRLEKEMIAAKEEQLAIEADSMDTDIMPSEPQKRKLVASRRVLLFSIVNCLTVVFHQESTSSTVSNGGAQLRKPALTFVITEVMNYVESYGGVFAALICTLLSDVMNSDPHVVYHIHQSGIAKSFIEMVKGKKLNASDKIFEPIVPPAPELIMALPNVIAALALTSEGASHVSQANPFPALLKILYHPKYAMPRSRCLLNEMTAITGTGLDEVMRHVPTLRTQIMEAIVESMNDVILIGKKLVEREENNAPTDMHDSPATSLENERTCLVQYTLNFGQMLEQILHTEDHCEPFVDAGGLTAILELFPLLIPPTTQFLANASCLSSPSVSTLSHTTTEDSLTTSFRCIAMNYDSQKMLNILSKTIELGINSVEETQRLIRDSFPSAKFDVSVSNALEKKNAALDAIGILDGMPNVGIHELRGSSNYVKKAKCLADYLRAIATLQWQISLLSTVVKAACQSSQDGGTGWGRAEREWKKELSSTKFENLLSRLAEFQHSAILEACRVRSQKEYESEFRQRHVKLEDKGRSVRYRLKIVCQEGAVVRDGTEIDSCSNVGSMEMGEVTDAFERCVNSSGVMRYRTCRGWVSELTRGHGREPITEVLDVSFVDSALVPKVRLKLKSKKRMEYNVASIRSVGASILARLQTSYRDLFCSLNRVISHGIRSLTTRTVSFDSGTIGAHTKTLLRVMLTSMTNALNQPAIVQVVAHNDVKDSALSSAGVAMYLGTILGIISSYLFEDKRERRMMNSALVIGMLNIDHHYCNSISTKLISEECIESKNIALVGMFDAIKFVMENALQSAFNLGNAGGNEELKPVQSLIRTTAASLPPVLDFLRKLMAGLPTKQSSMINALERLELEDLVTLLGGSKGDSLNNTFCLNDGKDIKFSFGQFIKGMHFTIAELVISFWKDERLKYIPSYVVHPLTILSTEVIGGLEEDIKPVSSSNSEQRRGFFSRISRGSAEVRQRQPDPAQNAEQQFAPSDEAVTRLMEMGFSRDHALDAIENTESNRLEVAMEYALSHPPPSPASAERRREARRQRNEAQRNENGDEIMNDSNEKDSSDGEMKADSHDDPKKIAAEKEENKERQIIARVKSCLDEWIDSMPSITVSLIGDGSRLSPSVANISQVEGEGDGDTEALTVVLCSFLIGLCQKYPKKMDVAVRLLLSALKNNLEVTQVSDKTVCQVKKGSEVQFSALCHAAVLFTRAVPKIRVIVLEYGLVRNFISSIDGFSSSFCLSSEVSWPMWLAPALLLLDVMAQPLVAFELDSCEKNETLSGEESQNDLSLVKGEHMRKRVSLSQVADQLFEAVKHAKQDNEKSKLTKKESHTAEKAITESKDVERSTNSPTKLTTTHDASKSEPKQDMELSDVRMARSAFSKIPPFFPLVTDEMARTALCFCLRLLGQGSPEQKGTPPPPGIVHAVLLLMARLVRSDLLASDCLKAHAPDLILALPRGCRFNGNAGLVTVIFRRLLEDDSNLQIEMETEIRGVLSKLHRKRNRQPSSAGEPSAPMHSFLQAVTPLLYRDPLTFLKAMLSTVSVDSTKEAKDDKSVTLLTQAERQLNLRAMSKIRPRSSRMDINVENKKLKLHSPKGSKGKMSHRGSLSRRGSFSKKTKKEKGDLSLNGTPSNHVISLMIEKLLSLYSNKGETRTDNKFGEDTSFLWVSDILEIMADLVLAVPTCAAAIHRYRSPSSKGHDGDDNPLSSLRHALTACQAPSKTVVNFLLHCLLPQDRWSYRQEQDLWDRHNHEDESWKTKKKESYMKTKVAQTTARLLVSLVARAGEGRRRVVAGLSFALSGGREHGVDKSIIQANSPVSYEESSEDLELCALRAWGDLCIGLAAPRSNGVNHDNDSNLSIDVVRLMLDFRMAHALLYAVGRVKLHHPMATSACGSLLVPLEVFTRAFVTDAIQSLLTKEETERETGGKATNSMETKGVKKKEPLTRGMLTGSSRRSETAFADDAMLADGFDAEAAIQNDICDDEDDMVDEDDHNDVDEDVDMEGQSEEDDDENDDEDEDSEIGDGEDTEDDEDDDSEERDDDDDVEEDDGDDDVEEDEDGAVDMWNEEMGEFFDGNGEDEVVQSVEESVQGRPDGGDISDDWDQVDAPPFGAMMLGGRHQMGNITNNARGFVDAAEAMIGSLLRTGEIQENALAEIEGTLGIRISGTRNASDWSQLDRERRWNSVGRPGAPQRAGNNRNNNNGSGTNNAEGHVLGSIPHVNQRSPPDVGYAGPGGGGRWNEISSMELVFGGPALTGGSRNFDVVSEAEGRPNNEEYAFPSAVDSQLFPGGPAASTHSRTQQSVHPLLCGVDLPPINSLVSNLMSHGERSIHRGDSSPRRSDEWTSWSISANHSGYVVSTSNGNLLRLSRSQLPSSATPRSAPGGLVGWSDDGQPFDGSMGNFSNAFETALNETIQVAEASGSTAQTEEAENIPSNDSEENNAEGNGQDVAGNDAETTVVLEERIDDETSADRSAPGEPTASNNNQVEGTDTVSENNESNSGSQSQEQEPVNSSNTRDRESSAVPSDAESVAPSLVEGLRLSDGAVEEAETGDLERAINDSTMTDQEQTIQAREETRNEESAAHHETSVEGQNEPNANGLVCPSGMDLEVFNSLPFEMQQEVIDQHQSTADLAAQLDSTSGLDPEALAALPEDMRREVIAQEQRERTLRDTPADPSNAEEMDNASFVASLAPELRRDILLTAEDTFLNSLPPNIIAEAQILRERLHQSRRLEDPATSQGNNEGTRSDGNTAVASAPISRKKQRHGKLKVNSDRLPVMYLSRVEAHGQRVRSESFPTEPFGSAELKSLIQLMFLLSPVRPQRLLQKVFQNICSNATLRLVICNAFTRLLSDDGSGAAATVNSLNGNREKTAEIGRAADPSFPPRSLIGTAPEVLDGSGTNPSSMFFRRRQGNSCAASIAASLPGSLKGSSNVAHVPPVVSTRVVDTLSFLGKNSPRVCLDALSIPSSGTDGTCFERMLDLLDKPRYAKSSTNLENLLAMIEIMISPLSGLSRGDEDYEDISSEEVEAAASIGKEWVEIPRIEVSQPRLQLLCSILKMESCRDAAFSRVNGISRRLCKVEANRGHILAELASVAQSLGEDAKRDLRLLCVRMNDVVVLQQRSVEDSGGIDGGSESSILAGQSPSSTVTLSSSSSELKLLRVLQTLQSLCSDNQSEDTSRRKSDGTVFVTPELIEILQGMNLNEMWEQLDACLKVVKVLEGISTDDESEEKNSDNDDDDEMTEDNTGSNTGPGDDGNDNMINSGKKLQNSSAGLLTRFLPAIEAFFVVNASATREETSTNSAAQGESATDEKAFNSQLSGTKHEVKVPKLVGGKSVVEFVSENKIILNALVRNNSSLLEKGLRALVQVPRCRSILDFDVKRQWFKTQIRRLRQQASRRRHGSLRLAIRRKYVFEDAYHQLRLRNADEMRSRLHISFRNEEGVDAGGLSREFFGILAKEMFNPNYALFTSTEDGCTFQPNPNSSINPDHLSYFRFVGRIVGKAVADGFLLDAHFTRSLYKHMLGIEPTHHDMEAIDPDYYKNLKMILEYNLADIGLDLTFSIDDISFGRSQIIDLIPGGRNIPVTDETKSRYVSLVCKHRMTTSIKSQIKAYLDGFYELVSPDLIAIFTPRELELLISGLPDIDVHDLKQNTEYQGWKATDPEIVWFWNIILNLSRSEKAAFLQFVTGSSKVPLVGFAELQGMRGIQKFSIHKAGGSSTDALMCAHTCFNSLDLPKYESEDKMKEKLLYAISEGQTGFLFA